MGHEDGVSYGHAWNLFHYNAANGEEKIFGMDATFDDTSDYYYYSNFCINSFESNHDDRFTEIYGEPFTGKDPSKINAGFPFDFINRYILVVDMGISLRPETYKLIEDASFTYMDMADLKEQNPEAFTSGPLESNREFMQELEQRLSKKNKANTNNKEQDNDWDDR